MKKITKRGKEKETGENRGGKRKEKERKKGTKEGV